MKFTFLDKSFTLLDKKHDRYFLILFCLAFSVVFLNLFVPFNINRWFSDSAFIQFLRLSSFGIVVSLVLLFSQFPLRTVFKLSSFKIKSFVLWFVFEIAITSLVYIFLYGNPIGNFINDFIFSLKYTFLGIGLPYSAALLIIYYKTRHFEFKLLMDEKMEQQGTNLLSFRDEQDKIRFSIAPGDVLLLESTDNYVTVHYFFEGKVQRKLLRNTLKKLENEMDKNLFIRCHRSYMVNVKNIGIVQKDGKKMTIHLKHLEKIIPVSEKYSSPFLVFLS